MNKEKLTIHMREFLIKLRENAKLSQKQVSERSGISEGKSLLDQKTVSRIEKQPLDGDIFKVAAYMTAIGSNLDAYSKEMQSVIQNDRGINMDQLIKSSSAYLIKDMMKKVDSSQELLNNFEHDYIKGLGLDKSFDQFSSDLKGLERKPVIGFFGHYDSAKSTLINTIINNEFLPTKYQPATSIVNLLIHKDEKPSYLSGDVALFRKGFLPHMINDHSLVEKYLIEEGDRSILDKYGTHDWDEAIMDSEAYISVSYLNAPILHRAWLLDTPGNLNDAEEQDIEYALSGVELVDGVVFCSGHVSYMNGEHVAFLTNILSKRLPALKSNPLDHVLFVKTHSHPAMTMDDIRSIESGAMKRIYKKLDTTVFTHWYESDAIESKPLVEDLTNKTCSFWRETEELRTETLSAIDEMSFYLMGNQDSLIAIRVQEIEKLITKRIAGAVAKLNSFKKSAEDRLKEVKEQDARFRKEADGLINQFNETIESTKKLEKECFNDLHMFYSSLSRAEYIEQLIEDNFEDKKEAEQGIGGVISQLLSTRLESTLKAHSSPFNAKIDQLLMSWQEIAPSISVDDADSDIDMDGIDLSGFDARSAFVGGLAGIGSFGAMALYVSGIASNLGAYILVGKAAGVLTSLGLASSVTGVTSFVAAIGGPITIGIALAAAIGYAVYRLFGGKWQSSLAKKVETALDKKSPMNDVKSTIEKYWSSTYDATTACLVELQKQTDKHIEKLYKTAQTDFDVDALNDCIDKVDNLNNNF